MNRLFPQFGLLVAGLLLVGAGCFATTEPEDTSVATVTVDTAQEAGGLDEATSILSGMIEESDEEAKADTTEEVVEEVVEETVEEVAEEPTETIAIETQSAEPVQEIVVEEVEETPAVVEETTQETVVVEETVEEVEEEVQKISVSIGVISPTGTRSDYSIKVDEGSTVEDAMKKAKNKGLRYGTRQFGGMGTYVESVNGEEESGGLYWVFYINGTRAISGISTYKLNEGDEVLWKFRAPGAGD